MQRIGAVFTSITNRLHVATSVMEAEGILRTIIECANFAAVKHKDQRRKDPEQTPYINHPIGVAYILTNEGGVSDPRVIKAALLHDTVEDTDTTNEEIKQHFGEDIARIVAEVTDDKSLPKQERKRLQVEHAPHISHKAKLVKLADKLYNLRDLNKILPVGYTEERRNDYFEWAAKVVKGLRGTNPDLEKSLDELFRARDIIID